MTEDMPIHYDYETDTLYLRGFEKGFKIGFESVFEKNIENPLIKFWKKGVELPMISNLMDMPITEVERIIAEYRKEQNV